MTCNFGVLAEALLSALDQVDAAEAAGLRDTYSDTLRTLRDISGDHSLMSAADQESTYWLLDQAMAALDPYNPQIAITPDRCQYLLWLAALDATGQPLSEINAAGAGVTFRTRAAAIAYADSVYPQVRGAQRLSIVAQDLDSGVTHWQDMEILRESV